MSCTILMICIEDEDSSEVEDLISDIDDVTDTKTMEVTSGECERFKKLRVREIFEKLFEAAPV